VGLTPSLLDHAPHLQALARGGAVLSLTTVLPAVTTTVQSTMLTGTLPRDHGIVGNGWYFRDLSEIWLWRQTNRLVAGKKVWQAARRRDPAFTCAKLFWWYNMYANVDFAVTPRPMYLADGRKLPDIHTHPAALRDELQSTLGEFPLFRFWGPAADLTSTRWIADCALDVLQRDQPDLCLVYLPHLDYALQKFGPEHPDIGKHLREIDDVCAELIAHVRRDGTCWWCPSTASAGVARRLPQPRIAQAGFLTALWQDSVGRDAGRG
jgi:predicted AlkP superfamily pyrophosphatase or phosphodiesterase